MPAVIVDIQYYRINGCDILKEASVLRMDNAQHHHFVFRSSYLLRDLSVTDRKTVEYICNELDMLHLHCGDQELDEFLSCIPPDAVLFICGHVKKIILKKLFPFHRIVDLKTPFRIMQAHEKCDFPYQHTQCSLTNVHKIYNFMCINEKRIE